MSGGENKKLLGKLLVIAVMMFGFGYALIPVYKHLCEVLGPEPDRWQAAGSCQEQPGRHEP